MRTTLKRGLGRGAAFDSNGSANGHAVVPPAPLGPVTLYRQPEPPPRSGWSLAARIVGWVLFVLSMLAAGVAGGAYLWGHETVADVAVKSESGKRAKEKLDLVLPGEPAVALVIGYDFRAEQQKGEPSRSDTLMLVRADPRRETISMLSLPRDMRVDIHCPGRSVFRDKINAAFSYCGEEGSLETVRQLTGVRVNYLITVNFRGFRQLVDKLGGVWMDVDRRYYNDRGGPYGYAKINLQPGYQRLTGYKALDYVRFRHTDSDFHRNARQQLFVRALKDQVKSSFTVTKLPQVIKVITENVEVGQGGGKDVSLGTVLEYANLAYTLPAGRIFQSKIEGLEGFSTLTTSDENISRAIDEFAHPDVEAPQKATSVALGEKRKVKVPQPKETTVTVLNGNGITGSASSASYLLGKRGYRMVFPPGGVPANAPTFDFFKTTVFFDPSQEATKPAARKVAGLFGSADVKRAPSPIAELANGAMLTVVVGQTFHGRLAPAPIDQTPERQEAAVITRTDEAYELLRERRRRVPFPLYVPTVKERSSVLSGSKPIRMYRIDPDGKHKTVRLVYRTGGNDYWGVQQTDWDDAPVLTGRNFVRNIGGRRYELYYSGPHLHMVVLRTPKASYWVVNSLLDKLSNETMIAIAKSLRPVAKVTD
jgi:LCP family protein required for cell wall assembly